MRTLHHAPETPLSAASLRLSGHSLAVTDNSIHVQLQLLLRAGNRTVKYDDIQKHARRYRVYIRRARDNQTVSISPPQSSMSQNIADMSLHCLLWWVLQLTEGFWVWLLPIALLSTGGLSPGDGGRGGSRAWGPSLGYQLCSLIAV